jgi:hypothetical protein
VLRFDVVHHLQHEPHWSLLMVFIWGYTTNGQLCVLYIISSTIKAYISWYQ